MRDETSKSLSDDVLREQIVTVEGMIRQAYASVDREEDFPKYFRPGGGFLQSEDAGSACSAGLQAGTGRYLSP
ncbi:hypothetical protein CIRG_09112 [Coccidioides immitis RMSCC 2394]|uniref:Uncharacterized protein n=1 Tax=Coccidioides immitis RMSCC 2394 TaxID=404692 RepID=A0A0J6YRH8_COCIT|nr:hypothetical protein CIRG_09112 [Coccidioides immitis RMSCC 2394]